MAEKEKIQEVPDGWVKVNLGQELTFQKGKVPKSIFNKYEGILPYLTPEYLRGNTLPENYFNVNQGMEVENGQVIILWDGSNAGEIFTSKSGLLASTMCLVIHYGNIVNEYLYYFLKQKEIAIKSKVKGSGIPHVDQDIFRTIYSVIPKSIHEQHTIAAVLSTCDEAIEKTDAKIEKLKRIKQGLMQDLFSYGIDENGKMRSEATHCFKDSPLGRIPEEWDVKTLEDVVNHIGSGVTPTGGEAVYQKEGIKFVRSQNVTFKGIFEEDIAYINESIHKRMQRSEIYSFDILLNITGASIGRCCVVPEYFGKANVNQHVCAIRLRERDLWLSSFVSYFLQSYLGQKQIDILNAGGNREGLNYQQIRSFHIYWPKKPEQSRIAFVLSSADEAIEKEEAYKNKLLAIKRGLMEDLLSGKMRVNNLIKEAA